MGGSSSKQAYQDNAQNPEHISNNNIHSSKNKSSAMADNNICSKCQSQVNQIISQQRALINQQRNQMTEKNARQQQERNKSIQTQRKRITQGLKIIHDIDDNVADIIELIIFLFSGWFLSLTWILNDNSECLMDYYQGIAFNLKTWHTVDLSLAISCLVFLIATILGAVWKQNIQGDEIFIFLFWLLTKTVIFFKLIWIIVGIFIFFIHLNFNRCSQRVIVYTGIQFIFFFSKIVITGLKKCLLNAQIKKDIQKYNRAMESIYLTKNDPDRRYRVSITKYSVEEHIINIFNQAQGFDVKRTGQKILDTIDKQIKFWALAGWILSFFFALNDQGPFGTQCTGATSWQNMLRSLNTWLWVDGGSTLCFTLIFLIITYQNYQRSKTDTNYDNRPLLSKFIYSKDWRKKDITIVRILELLIAFKIAWMIVGYVIFLKFMDLNNCRDYTIDYLMFYFTWSIYIIVMVILMRLVIAG